MHGTATVAMATFLSSLASFEFTSLPYVMRRGVRGAMGEMGRGVRGTMGVTFCRTISDWHD